MATGTVTVGIYAPIEGTLETAIAALRVTANDKWGFIPIANGMQIMIIHIEEA